MNIIVTLFLCAVILATNTFAIQCQRSEQISVYSVPSIPLEPKEVNCNATYCTHSQVLIHDVFKGEVYGCKEDFEQFILYVKAFSAVDYYKYIDSLESACKNLTSQTIRWTKNGYQNYIYISCSAVTISYSHVIIFISLLVFVNTLSHL